MLRPTLLQQAASLTHSSRQHTLAHTHCSKGKQDDKREKDKRGRDLLNLFILQKEFSSYWTDAIRFTLMRSSAALLPNLSISVVGFRTGAPRKDKGNEKARRSAEEKPLRAREMATTIQLQWLQVSRSIIQPTLGFTPKPAPRSLDWKSQTGREYLPPQLIDRRIHLAQPTATSKVSKSL